MQRYENRLKIVTEYAYFLYILYYSSISDIYIILFFDF